MINQCKTIDGILLNYQSDLGKDFTPYSNHCYRLLNFMMLMRLDDIEENKCRILLPFHDLGIWTHRTMNYLPPSIDLALDYVRNNNLPITESEIIGFIGNHHKVSKNKNYLEEKLRRADLMDLTNGLFRFGLSSKKIKEIKRTFPNRGFQLLIYKKVIKYGIKNIRNPFPMMKF